MSAELLASSVERFRELGEVSLFDAAGNRRPAEIESAWQHRGLAILKFRGIDTISDAECLRGCEVRIPRSERAPLPVGEYYQSDLVGCEVVEWASGERLGTVTGWLESGGPPLLEVDAGGKEPMLVPFARSICVAIEPEARRIVVDLPEGLKEL